MELMVTINQLKCATDTVYSRKDIPELPRKFSRPDHYSSGSSEENHGWEDDEPIAISKKVFREIWRGRDISSLLAELQAIVAGEEEGGNKALATRETIEAATDNPIEEIRHENSQLQGLGAQTQRVQQGPGSIVAKLSRGASEGETQQDKTRMLHQGNTENLVIKSGPQKQPQAITPNTNLVRCILQRQIETGRNQGLNDSPQRINRGSGMSAAPLEASRNVGDVRQATKDVPTLDSLGESTETESGSKNRQDSEQPCNELYAPAQDKKERLGSHCHPLQLGLQGSNLIWADKGIGLKKGKNLSPKTGMGFMKFKSTMQKA